MLLTDAIDRIKKAAEDLTTLKASSPSKQKLNLSPMYFRSRSKKEALFRQDCDRLMDKLKAFRTTLETLQLEINDRSSAKLSGEKARQMASDIYNIPLNQDTAPSKHEKLMNLIRELHSDLMLGAELEEANARVVAAAAAYERGGPAPA